MNTHTIGRVLLAFFVLLVLATMFFGPFGSDGGAARVDAGSERSEEREDLDDVDLARDATGNANDLPHGGEREEVGQIGAPAVATDPPAAADGRLWRDLVRPVDDATRAAVEGVEFEVVLESGERFTATLDDPFDERAFAEPALARATVDTYCPRVFDPRTLDGREELPVDLRLAPTASALVRFADGVVVPGDVVCTVSFEIDRYLDPDAARLGTGDMSSIGAWELVERNLATLFEGEGSEEWEALARPSWALGAGLPDALFDAGAAPVDAIFVEREVEMFGAGSLVVDGVPAGVPLTVRVRPGDRFVLAFEVPGTPLAEVPVERNGRPVPFTRSDDALEVVIDALAEPGALLGAFPAAALELEAYALTVDERLGDGFTGEPNRMRPIEPEQDGTWIVDDVHPGRFRVRASWQLGDRVVLHAERSGELGPGERLDLGLIEASAGHTLTIVPRVEIDGIAIDPASDSRFVGAQWRYQVLPIVDGRMMGPDMVGGRVDGFAPCGIGGLASGSYGIGLLEPDLAKGGGPALRFDGWIRDEPIEITADRTVEATLRYSTIAHNVDVRIDTEGVEEVLPALRYAGWVQARNVATGEVVGGRDPGRFAPWGLEREMRRELPLGPGTWELTAMVRVDQNSLADHRPLDLETLRRFRGHRGRATIDVALGGARPVPVTITLQPGVTLIGPRDAFVTDPEARPPHLVASIAGIESAVYPIPFHEGATIVYLGLVPGTSYRDDASGFSFLAPAGGGVHELAGVGD